MARYVADVLCLSCGDVARSALCVRCAGSLQPAPERRLPGGILVQPALVHQDAARRLVHHLKYRGIASAADVLAERMAAALSATDTCLIPVPRVLLRMWRYGIDPAEALAGALSRITGIPVEGALSRPLWWAGRAGPSHATRGRPSFRGRRPVPVGAVLVDDVLTTGATLASASVALGGVLRAVTATGPAHRAGGQ